MRRFAAAACGLMAAGLGGPAAGGAKATPHFATVGRSVTIAVPARLTGTHATHAGGTTRVAVRVQRDAAAKQLRVVTAEGVVLATGAEGGFVTRGVLGAGARLFAWGLAGDGRVRMWTPALTARRTLRSLTPALPCLSAKDTRTAIAGPFALTIPTGAKPGAKKLVGAQHAAVFGPAPRIATTRGVVVGQGATGVVRGGFALAGAVFAYGTLDGKPVLWTPSLAGSATTLVRAPFAACRVAPGTATTPAAPAASTTTPPSTSTAPAPLTAFEHTLATTTVTSTPDTPHRATRTIGALGGTVATTGADGTHYVLAVPPGALTGSTAISMTPTAVTGLAAFATAVPYAVDFAPQGLSFAHPATLTITPPSGTSARPTVVAHWEDGQAGVELGTVRLGPGGTLVATVDHFSGAAIVTVDQAHSLAAIVSAATIAANGPAYAKVAAEVFGLPATATATAADMMTLYNQTIAPNLPHVDDDLTHFFTVETLLLKWDAVLIAAGTALDALPSGIPATPTLDDVRSAADAEFVRRGEALLSRFEPPGCTGAVTQLKDWFSIPTAIDGELSGPFGEQLGEVTYCAEPVAESIGFPTTLSAGQQLITATLRGEIVAPAGTPAADGTNAAGQAFFRQPTVYDLSVDGATFASDPLALSTLTATEADGTLPLALDRGSDPDQRTTHVGVDGIASIGGTWAELAAALQADVNVPVHLSVGPPSAVDIHFRSPPDNAILAPGATSNLCVVVTDGAGDPVVGNLPTVELDGPGALGTIPHTDGDGVSCFDYHHPAGIVSHGDTATITATATHGADQDTDATTLTPKWAAITLETSVDLGVSYTPATNTTVSVAPGTVVTLRPTVTIAGATASDPGVPADGETAQVDVESGGGTLSDTGNPPNTVLLPILDSAGQDLIAWDPGGATGDTTLRVSYPPPGLGLAGLAATVTIHQRPPVTVVVSPATTSVMPGGAASFTATVTGAADPSVAWTATGGTIDATGTFVGGATPGVYTVTAVSVADPSSAGTATVAVGAPGLVVHTGSTMSSTFGASNENGLTDCGRFDEAPHGATSYAHSDGCSYGRTLEGGSTMSDAASVSGQYAVTFAADGGIDAIDMSDAISASASVCVCGSLGATASAASVITIGSGFLVTAPTLMTVHAVSSPGNPVVEVSCTFNPIALVRVPIGGSVDTTITLPAFAQCGAGIQDDVLPVACAFAPPQECSPATDNRSSSASIHVTFAPAP